VHCQERFIYNSFKCEELKIKEIETSHDIVELSRFPTPLQCVPITCSTHTESPHTYNSVMLATRSTIRKLGFLASSRLE
jgi:hypothetical protein